MQTILPKANAPTVQVEGQGGIKLRSSVTAADVQTVTDITTMEERQQTFSSFLSATRRSMISQYHTFSFSF